MATDKESSSSKKILQLHKYKKQYRGHSGTTEKDFIADFHFTLREADGSSPPITFWSEVNLRSNLATRDGWKDLSKDDRFKALYSFAIEAIQKSGGRPIRHMTLGWIPSSSFAEGPSWDLSKVNLKNPAPVEIEGEGILPVVVEQH